MLHNALYFLLSPPCLLILGGCVSILLRRRYRIGGVPLRGLWAILISALACLSLIWLPRDNPELFSFAHIALHPMRVDSFGLLFALAFSFISFCGHIYALKSRSIAFVPVAMFYAGAACGVVLSGDLICLYFFWEIMAVSATFLILSSRSNRAFQASMRYVAVHIAGGLILLAGIVLHYLETGSVALDYIGLVSGTYGDWFIFIGFAINAGIFPLHAWITDSYPESSIYGTVFLAALTTKSAACVLARSFAGAEALIWLGLAGAVWATIYAIMGGNIRRVLSYCLVTQVGMMLCGIGMGSELAVNGAVAHAVASDLYQVLLFMVAGCLVYATGNDKLSNMGGLRRKMPLVCGCALVATATACGLPLLAGFVSKSITVYAAQKNIMATAELGDVLIWFTLMTIVTGVTVHVGAKCFYLPFFGKAKTPNIIQPRKNMQLAMVLMALPCVIIGIFPRLLYGFLPYPFKFQPYTVAHVLESCAYVIIGGLIALAIYKIFGKLCFEKQTLTDTDVVYRKGAEYFYESCNIIFNNLNDLCAKFFMDKLPRSLRKFAHNFIFYIFMFFVTILVRLKIIPRASGRHISITAGRTLATATLPIGLTGFVIVVFIIIQLFFILVDY